MAKVVIGVLAAIALVLLYRGMQRAQSVTGAVDNEKILIALREAHQRCDTVESFMALGKDYSRTLDGYLARCRDGGRYIYFRNTMERRVGVISCQEEVLRYNYRCPD